MSFMRKPDNTLYDTDVIILLDVLGVANMDDDKLISVRVDNGKQAPEGAEMIHTVGYGGVGWYARATAGEWQDKWPVIKRGRTE